MNDIPQSKIDASKKIDEDIKAFKSKGLKVDKYNNLNELEGSKQDRRSIKPAIPLITSRQQRANMSESYLRHMRKKAPIPLSDELDKWSADQKK